MSDVPIPGTVRLVDLQGTSALRHGKNQKDIILVPQPTDDPNDPLNWSPSRKLLSSIWQMALPFCGGMSINGLTPAYLLIQAETGISLADLNTGNGLMYLFFGLGNLIAQPIAINYGRRPTAVGSLTIMSFLVLWSSFMKTSAEWFANRILVGIFFSTIECLIELCIADTKFTHERGFHMGFYNWSLFGGALFSPIPAGFLADAAGWRWINRMYAILGFLTALGTFLFLEETMFYRPGRVDEFLNADPQSSSKAIDIIGTGDPRPTSESNPHPTSESHQIAETKSKEEAQRSPVEEVGETHEIKTFKQRLRLWGLRDPRQPNTFLKFFFLPFTLLRYPGIVFSGLLVGSVLSWYNVLLGTITQVFSGDPYNFSANMVGLTYLACVTGTTVGCIVSGWLNDSIATWLARRNDGVKEPEARLWVAIVPFILHPAGCILYGVGAAHQIHWVGLCFGLGIITLSIVMGSTLALSYVVDCYKEIAGEALVTVILIRNLIGFAFGYAVVPMVDSLGLQNSFLLCGFLGMGFISLCFLMILFGKRMRKTTAMSYWNLVEKHGFKAH